LFILRDWRGGGKEPIIDRVERVNPMIVTVFRSRLNPGAQEGYAPMAKRLGELARSMPGYVSHKGFVAEDGERLTLVEFATEEGLKAWARQPDHVEGKRLGIQRFFSEYRVQICQVIKDSATRAQRPRGAEGRSTTSPA
jgi:heme-degrading monooxygenase HmoA